jgi:hypothetical protein
MAAGSAQLCPCLSDREDRYCAASCSARAAVRYTARQAGAGWWAEARVALVKAQTSWSFHALPPPHPASLLP